MAEPSTPRGRTVHKLRRCPNCGAVTERVSHCFEKGHPMFPQTDDYTATEPVEVMVVVDCPLCRGRGCFDCSDGKVIAP